MENRGDEFPGARDEPREPPGIAGLCRRSRRRFLRPGAGSDRRRHWPVPENLPILFHRTRPKEGGHEIEREGGGEEGNARNGGSAAITAKARAPVGISPSAGLLFKKNGYLEWVGVTLFARDEKTGKGVRGGNAN